jgi:hypothetical protein
MVPSSIATLIAFFVLVAPGVLFSILRERWRPSLEESTFREVSRVVLASTGFSAISVALLSVVRAVAPSLMPDPGAWLLLGKAYVQLHYGLIAGFVGAELALAIVLVLIANLIYERTLKAGSIKPFTAWWHVFRDIRPANKFAVTRVLTEGGSVYEGTVGFYSTGAMASDRDLVLSPPIFLVNPSAELEPLPPEWQRLIIPAPAIKAIWTRYVPIQRIRDDVKKIQDSLP